MKLNTAICEPPMDPSDDVAPVRQLIEMQAKRENLQDRYEWLKAMIDHVPDFIYAKDRQGRFLFANRAVVENNGLSSVEELIGLTDAEIHSKKNVEAHQIDQIEQHVMESGESSLGGEERRMKGDGWLMMSRVPLRDGDDSVIGVVGASRDITARKRAEELMAAQATLLREVATGVELQTFLRGAEALLKRLIPGSDAEIICDETQHLHHAERSAFLLGSRSGPHQGALLLDSSSLQEPGLMDFVMGVSQTIGIAVDRHYDLARVAYLAERDPLTGLPNRAVLDRELGLLLTQPNCVLAVAFIDLDNFKLVNDSLGHAAGDELLKITAGRISEALEPGDMASRIGGDEFVVVLQKAPEEARAVLERVLEIIRKPMSIDGVALTVTTSIGIAYSGQHGASSADLCARADMALYRAKAKGRNGIEVFSADMLEAAQAKFRRVEELRRAIENDEFVPFFQIQKDTDADRICGVEVLVRWQHPTAGLLSPADFIPLAEQTGLIVEIGDMVLNKACMQLRYWLDKGFSPLRIGVNVSARQFCESGFSQRVARALARAQLDPALLEIEVTESLIMEDVDLAILGMNALRELGVNLSIDDFGTGYSSLSMLKRFPIARLKIDRSFIADIPENAGDMAITRAIIAMAHALGLDVVAEGVETQAQVDFLKDAGCSIFQGYLFSRPVPARDAEALLERR